MLDLIAFSQVCKAFRKIVMDNTLTWCSNLDTHPNLPAPYYSDFRPLTCLYQLYELYRRNMIDKFTYCQQKSRFFTDEQLIEQCSYMFVIPENRKSRVIDFCPTYRPDRPLTEKDAEDLVIVTIYGLEVRFWVEDSWKNPPGPDKFKTVWDGDLSETETCATSTAFNFTLQTSSNKMLTELLLKWTGWGDSTIQWLLDYGCPISCIKEILESTSNCEDGNFLLYENTYDITASLGSVDCTEDLATFWVFYATQVKQLDVENLVILFNDAIIKGQVKKFPNLKKTLAQMPGFVEYASRLYLNVHEIFEIHQ